MPEIHMGKGDKSRTQVMTVSSDTNRAVTGATLTLGPAGLPPAEAPSPLSLVSSLLVPPVTP